MSDNFFVEIISPDQSILKSEAVEAIIPSYEGQIGILKDHIPLITILRPGIIVIKQDVDEKSFFVEEGTVEFVNNNLLILSTSAQSLDNLNKESIDMLIKNSQDKMSKTDNNDKENYLLSHKIDVLKEIN